MLLAIASAGSVEGGVDLQLVPRQNQAGVGALFEVDVRARSNAVVGAAVSAMDLIITWDRAKSELQGHVVTPSAPWFFSGFFPDDQADGLNSSLADGDALFQAVAPFDAPISIPTTGVTVLTLRFRALSASSGTGITLARTRGQYSRTQIFEANQTNVDLLSGMFGCEMRLLTRASLTALDVTIPPQRVADALVHGELTGGWTFGVTIMLELAPQQGATGTVRFTPAPPTDIEQAGDPWPGAGTFTPIDAQTEGTASVMMNGGVDDNGTFVASPLTYSGPLMFAPMESSPDAGGAWDLRLLPAAGASGWEGVTTLLSSGVVRVVALGDGDGGARIDVRDFSELQRCFTGSVMAGNTPAFSRHPTHRCGVYDFDDDGDVDAEDYNAFESAMSGGGE